MDNCRVYQFRVKGHLGEDWSVWFDPLVIQDEPNGEATLTGYVRDQSALYGLLVKIRDLNLELISVTRMDQSDVG